MTKMLFLNIRHLSTFINHTQTIFWLVKHQYQTLILNNLILQFCVQCITCMAVHFDYCTVMHSACCLAAAGAWAASSSRWWRVGRCFRPARRRSNSRWSSGRSGGRTRAAGRASTRAPRSARSTCPTTSARRYSCSRPGASRSLHIRTKPLFTSLSTSRLVFSSVRLPTHDSTV